MSTRSLAGQNVVSFQSPEADDSRRRSARGSKLSFWRRWLVLLIVGFLIILSEITDHQKIHDTYQSGLSLLEDTHLLQEIVVLGLVFPLLTGLFLTYVERVGAERDEAARALEERRQFVRRVHNAADWEQLAQFVVGFPGSFVEATRAFLMVQRSQEESFGLVSSWYRQAEPTRVPGPPVLPDVCQVCAAAISGRQVSTTICPHDRSENGRRDGTRYCLWFVAGEQGKAALIFDVPAQHPLADQQLQLLNDLGTEAALAIENANLLYVGGRQQEAAKKERQRIAHDLHDTLGQNISYLHLKLDQLMTQDALIGIAEVQREIMKMRDVASDAYYQVRNTLEELRPEKHGPLLEAVRAFAEEVSQRTDFTIDVHGQGPMQKLHPYVQRQVLYIVREALNNVEKHADARHVVLDLSWADEELTLGIADDGTGFSPGTEVGAGRYGLLIMDERARALGGRLIVTSKPGAGTNVTLHLPLSGTTAYDAKRAEAS